MKGKIILWLFIATAMPLFASAAPNSTSTFPYNSVGPIDFSQINFVKTKQVETVTPADCILHFYAIHIPDITAGTTTLALPTSPITIENVHLQQDTAGLDEIEMTANSGRTLVSHLDYLQAADWTNLNVTSTGNIELETTGTGHSSEGMYATVEYYNYDVFANGEACAAATTVTQTYDPIAALLAIGGLILAFFLGLGYMIMKIRKMGK